jgi:hypothetical protein
MTACERLPSATSILLPRLSARKRYTGQSPHRRQSKVSARRSRAKLPKQPNAPTHIPTRSSADGSQRPPEYRAEYRFHRHVVPVHRRMNRADVFLSSLALYAAVVQRRQARLQRHQRVEQACESAIPLPERVYENEFRVSAPRALLAGTVPSNRESRARSRTGILPYPY